MASTTSSNPTTQPPNRAFSPPRHRTVIHEASTMINNGGLGPPTNPLYPTPRTSTPSELSLALDTYEQQYYPSQPKSLSGIALRAFTLGLTLTLSLTTSIYLLSTSSNLWRLPFSIASLSLFHFLEFYTTALTNVPSASVASFLLSSNGSAYTIAHIASILECLLSHYLLPTSILPLPIHNALLYTGLFLIILGQSIRASAMLTAGTNFSHFVRKQKSQTHKLVQEGVYRWFRHPSYFGYFWWAMGTQLVYGNAVCFVGFGVVLWRFFSRRIEGEEELLVRFFGGEYERYRGRTWVGIPFIK